MIATQYHDVTINKRENSALFHYIPPLTAEIQGTLYKEIGFEEWNKFIRDLYRCYITNWEERYVDSRVLDGTQWELEITFEDNTKLCRYGINDYPPYWNKLLKLFKTYVLTKIK